MLAMRLAGKFHSLLAQFRLGVGLWPALEFRLAARAAQEVIHALILDHDMGLAAMDPPAAHRVFEHEPFRLGTGRRLAPSR